MTKILNIIIPFFYFFFVITSTPVISQNDAFKKIEIGKKARIHLSEAIKFKTISYQNRAKFDGKQFLQLHDFLKESYPKVHVTLKREIISDYSLLYTWRGKQPNLKPILLIAHIDVVPIEPGTKSKWTHPPFEGTMEYPYAWGRGTLDDKSSLIAILEAVEFLLNDNFKPQRTIYLAFGHDEEIGGKQGAGKISKKLQSAHPVSILKKGKIKGGIEFILDEGLFITEGIFPEIKEPIALIGTAEKGYLTLELKVDDPEFGGHASMPPKQTAIGILSTAVHRLEKKQFSTKLILPVKQMLKVLGAKMTGTLKAAMKNPGVSAELIKKKLSELPATNALIRTTIAPTMFKGSGKENVLPAQAKVVINFRILPGETVKSTMDFVKKVINDDRIAIKKHSNSNDPSKITSKETESYKLLEKTIKDVFPGVMVSPSLLPGGTDSKHYQSLTNNIFRFNPVKLNQKDLKRIHGVNERISYDGYKDMIRFYYHLMWNAGKDF
ncbi:MAG: M20/M25/M40 family metallo-hydrolase [Bacteroidetes bacterium]|nr:M20/M25/M40 family metallo-hydrolase [Bacteroidota bacterium]